MRCELKQVRIVEKELEHPSGEFRGEWSGYVVTWRVNRRTYQAKTSVGVRGKVACTVVALNGEFTVIR